MSSLNKIILFFFSIILSACSSQPTSQHLTGHIVLGHEVSAFKRCNAKPTDDAWLYADEPVNSTLTNAYNNLVKEPYEEVFAELEGTIESAKDCEFCKNYNSSVKVLEVKKLRKASSSDCQ